MFKKYLENQGKREKEPEETNRKDKMLDISANISTVTLTVGGLNISIKRKTESGWNKHDLIMCCLQETQIIVSMM